MPPNESPFDEHHLPWEMLQEISLRLNPKSLTSLLSASKSIRSRLATDSFWIRYCKTWHIVIPPISLVQRDISPIDECGDRSVWERIVALGLIRSNVKSNRCDVSKFLCNGKETVWSESHAAISLPWEHEAPVRVWKIDNSSTELNFPRGGIVTARTLAMWRHYLVFTPENWHLEKEKLTLLKIFDLSSDNLSDRVVSVDVVPEDVVAPYQRCCTFACVSILETAEGTCKAVVFHKQQPHMAFVVKIPEGQVERRIRLPIANPVKRLIVQQTEMDSVSMSVYHAGWNTAMLHVFTPSAEKTVAKLVGMKPNFAACEVTAEGIVIGVRLRTTFNAANGLLMTKAYLEMRRNGKDNVDDDGNDDLVLKVNGGDESEVELVLAERFVGGAPKVTVKINQDFNVAIVQVQAALKVNMRTMIFVVRYKLNPADMEMVFKFDLTRQDVRCFSMAFDRFVVVTHTKSSGYLLNFYSVVSGLKMAVKKLGVSEMTWGGVVCCQMKISEVWLTFTKGCVLVKY